MKRLGTLVWVLMLIACEAAAQTAPKLPLPVPVSLCDGGLMQGFPPPSNKQVTRAKGCCNWLLPPNNRWSYKHTRELVPSKLVSRRTTPVAELPEDLKDLDKLDFEDPTVPLDPTGAAKKISFDDFIKKTYTDAIIVLHNGKIVYERYENCMKQETPHLLFSASKSFVGLIAAIMAYPPSQGVIDEKKQVSEYVSQLAGSAYGDAKIREVMDMQASVKFSEDYSTNPQSDIRCIRCYLAAANWWIPGPLECQGPTNLYEALLNLKDYDELGPHGLPFDAAKTYKSPNADVLAWVVSKVSNKSLAELVSEMIWSKIGAESDAYYLVDAVGKEAAFGGLNATLRDFARFGQMMLKDGNWPQQWVVPSGVIPAIMTATTDGAPPPTGLSYRSLWWRRHITTDPCTPNIGAADTYALIAMGTNGQWLYIYPHAKLVVAKFGSDPTPDSEVAYPLHRRAFDKLACHLNKP